MTALNKHAELRQLATDAHELGIIKRYTKGIEANKRFDAIATPLTMLALLDELEAAEKRIAEHDFENQLLANADRDIKALRQRIAELEARTITVKFEPIPMEELGNRRDGKKHPYMFGAGYNSAVVHCESVLHQACAAAGIGVKGE